MSDPAPPPAPDPSQVEAEQIGRPDIGDVAVTIPVFPRVPITILFWKGDTAAMADFDVADGKVLYALGALKNVGLEAMDLAA